MRIFTIFRQKNSKYLFWKAQLFQLCYAPAYSRKYHIFLAQNEDFVPSDWDPAPTLASTENVGKNCSLTQVFLLKTGFLLYELSVIFRVVALRAHCADSAKICACVRYAKQFLKSLAQIGKYGLFLKIFTQNAMKNYVQLDWKPDFKTIWIFVLPKTSIIFKVLELIFTKFFLFYEK